jgi:hypothetical protein
MEQADLISQQTIAKEVIGHIVDTQIDEGTRVTTRVEGLYLSAAMALADRQIFGRLMDRPQVDPTYYAWSNQEVPGFSTVKYTDISELINITLGYAGVARTGMGLYQDDWDTKMIKDANRMSRQIKQEGKVPAVIQRYCDDAIKLRIDILKMEAEPRISTSEGREYRDRLMRQVVILYDTLSTIEHGIPADLPADLEYFRADEVPFNGNKIKITHL